MEEPQEGPKWLKELEEKRERRLKARLGHEAGAGSPCLTCEDKCPGLDLHFWRKICKNCKCGKENHDVNDDDIYGWAQFQLLGSKPNKAKKIVLPGRKDVVELEWTPKGQNDVVESYLKDLPVNLLPIKGSAAAQERKQLLQKQIPLHDIDPTLCHALSDNEIKQMNDYVAHVKQSSVGVGHIMKLNELLKARQQSANAQFLSSRAPMQVPQVQNIVLQGADRSNSLLKNNGDELQKGLKDLSIDEKKSVSVLEGEQFPSKVGDVLYDVRAGERGNAQPNSVGVSQGHIRNMQVPQQPVANQIDYQNSANVGGVLNINYPLGRDFNDPNQPIYNKNDYQSPSNIGGPWSVQYPGRDFDSLQNPTQTSYNQTSGDIGGLWNMKFPGNTGSKVQNPNQPICNQNDYQNPSNIGGLWNMQYPGSEFNKVQNSNPNQSGNTGGVWNMKLPVNNQGANVKIPNYPLQNHNDYQNPTNFGTIGDIRYPHLNKNVDPKLPNTQIPNNPIYNQIDYQNASNIGGIQDVRYPPNIQNPTNQANQGMPVNFAQMQQANPQNLKNYANNTLNNMENTQKPYDYAQIRDVYPDLNVNFEPNASEINPTRLDNMSSLKGDPNMPHYAPGKYSTFAEQQNPQRIGNIKDLAYSTYDPSDTRNENLLLHDSNLGEDFNKENNSFNPKYSQEDFDLAKHLSSQQPANYNPNEINVSEQNLNPTSVNVGIINDIEYPTIKSAVQKQNVFEPELPQRKNVQFDLNPEEILPSCHKCRKMFDATAIVIGIDRTDALWHAECFKCTGCNQNLADLMYFYHNESDDIYCGRDYAKIKGIPRCQACDELIFVKEYCLAENSTFHVKHFCCFECDEPLAGQNYLVEDSQPLCLPCYEKIKAEKCAACLKIIKADEEAAKLNGVHFHADDVCFVCKTCKKPLLGAKMLFKNMSLYCSGPCFNADK